MDEKDNKYYAYLYHVNVETEEVTQWTHKKDRVSSPKWSTDGKYIAFLSNREEKNQVYILSARGGEAKKVTNLEKGISSFIGHHVVKNLVCCTIKRRENMDR